MIQLRTETITERTLQLIPFFSVQTYWSTVFHQIPPKSYTIEPIRLDVKGVKKRTIKNESKSVFSIDILTLSFYFVIHTNEILPTTSDLQNSEYFQRRLTKQV